MKHMTWTATALGLAASLATPAAALECADGTRAFAHMGGETCIPAEPQRIIGLHDQSVTLTLVELGAPVVGSHGRIDDSGALYLRSVDLLFGLDFENSGISYAGTWEQMDFEGMAAMEPDLIIGREWEMADREKYEAIAPTVFIANSTSEPMNFPRDIADAAGVLDTYDRQLGIYQANLERARFALPDVQGATYSKLQGWDGKLEVYAGYGGLTKVIEDIGMVKGTVGQEMADRGVVWGETVSVEVLPQLEADYLFDTYTIAYGDTLADPEARLNEAVPGWCDFLSACAAGRYVVLPREYSTGYSFTQLNMLLQMVTTNVANAPAPAS
ncbi:MAG: ABC transporter substrate-binding protein [Pseudomonadota bacterium]